MDPPPTATAYFASAPAERALTERAFSYSLRLPNGTRRYTYAGRLHDVNRWMSSLLPQVGAVRALDVAISSGTTTLEWLEELDTAGIPVEMVATDTLLTGYLVSVSRRLAVLTDASGHPLQYVIGSRAVDSPPGGRNCLRFFVPLAFLTLARWIAAFGPGWERPSLPPVIATRSEVDLVRPELRQHPRVTLREEDLLHAPDGADRYHAIRAANILNRCYFSGDQLSCAIRNLATRLAPGGILVICSTSHDELNAASALLHNREGRLQLVARLHGGVEVEDLALGTSCLR